MRGIEAGAAFLHALRGDAGAGGLVRVKRTRAEIVEAEKNPGGDHNDPAENDGELAVGGADFILEFDVLFVVEFDELPVA